MGSESQALDRAKLEQKDRAELATIVEAMGGKATSRAKKADLVALVLELAGVNETDTVEAAAAEAPAAPAASARQPARSASTRAADTGPSLPEPEVVVPDGAEGEEGLSECELAFAVEKPDSSSPAVAPAGRNGDPSPR